MSQVTIYTTAMCPYCIRAKRLLDSKQVEYVEINVAQAEERAKMVSITSGTTVPQIIINDKPIGGCDELHALERSGKLDKLLNK